ncbi:MAG: LLM class flavin-dependent oxidoreductase [Actinobacteria bacterium]|nr:LLM class flavin-dependent oxidoreductase [Actinomycetota bacterium]
MTTPRFGLMLPQLRMGFDTIADRVVAAEQAGFHSVWFMDHLVTPAASQLPTFEGWTVASALAPMTRTIRLGHLVLCNELRHPALLAKMVASLDVISRGRVELGLGWGSYPAELEMFGFPERTARTKAARLRETIEILGHMFRGEAFDYDGTHFTLRGAIGRPVPVQEKIPLTIGGSGERFTLPLVNELADWWNCPTYAVDRLADLAPLVRDGVRISVQHPIGLAPSSAQREEEVVTSQRRFGSWGGLVTGTPDEVAARLRRETRLGAELFVCQFSDFGTPRTLQLFMDEVAPALRS